MPARISFIIDFRGAFIGGLVLLSPDFMGFGASHTGQEDDRDAGWLGRLSGCRHLLNTCIVEGINNTIKVIKRRAYGYQDNDYFFLNVKAAFPSNPR